MKIIFASLNLFEKRYARIQANTADSEQQNCSNSMWKLVRVLNLHRWIVFDPLYIYTLSLSSFGPLYKWELYNTRQHLVVNTLYTHTIATTCHIHENYRRCSSHIHDSYNYENYRRCSSHIHDSYNLLLYIHENYRRCSSTKSTWELHTLLIHESYSWRKPCALMNAR